MVAAPLNNFLEHGGIDIRYGNRLLNGLFSEIANHVLDQNRALGDITIWSILAKKVAGGVQEALTNSDVLAIGALEDEF